ncbi:hypothetical protein CgunFtcFv8_011522 [Champsocephalus gunnari]|uniref:Uncharacterized protein n=1 Tax=Champsocephalus gunnari TaxID=52237 RepID=A0AAN8HHH6_CHAGU|nr:hypothetical protein CgunFtcFv8_011522 [Champsocephalus gunnari]
MSALKKVLPGILKKHCCIIPDRNTGVKRLLMKLKSREIYSGVRRSQRSGRKSRDVKVGTPSPSTLSSVPLTPALLLCSPRSTAEAHPLNCYKSLQL